MLVDRQPIFCALHIYVYGLFVFFYYGLKLIQIIFFPSVYFHVR